MKISIFGMGYVGAVAAACLAEEGHTIIGVDPNPVKVDLINRGAAPIIETGLEQLLQDAVNAGRLSASVDAESAVHGTDMSFICVGTPSQLNGSLDLTYRAPGVRRYRRALATKTAFHVVVARSTMLPGSMRDVVIPTLEEASGKRAGVDFGVCNNPEFLRESTAIYDYHNPPKTVIGEIDAKSGQYLVRYIFASGCTVGSHRYRNRRNGEVHRQCLACAKGRFCQRNR